MIGQIGYLVKVSRRTGIVSAALYTLGTTSGAVVLGLVVGALGWGARWLFAVPSTPRTANVLLVMGGLAVLGGLWDLGAIPLALPGPIKQLPRHWLAVLGPYKTSLLWGVHVGFGRKTRVGYALYYVLIAWVALAGSPASGAVVLGLYGLVHGLLLMVEVAAIAAGHADAAQGLFGVGRSGFFYRYAGVALLACGVFLLTQSGML